MRAARPSPSGSWHLRSITPFIINLCTLIDILFDERRLPGRISVSRSYNSKVTLTRHHASSVFMLPPLPPTDLNHISLSRLISEKGQTFPPIHYFLRVWGRRDVSEMDPGQSCCEPPRESWARSFLRWGEAYVAWSFQRDCCAHWTHLFPGVIMALPVKSAFDKREEGSNMSTYYMCHF